MRALPLVSGHCVPSNLAIVEGEGFEPPSRLDDCRVSSAMVSTTHPTFQVKEPHRLEAMRFKCSTRPSLGLSISALRVTFVCFYVIQYVKEPFDSVSSKVTRSLFIVRSGLRQGLYDSTISGAMCRS